MKIIIISIFIFIFSTLSVTSNSLSSIEKLNELSYIENYNQQQSIEFIPLDNEILFIQEYYKDSLYYKNNPEFFEYSFLNFIKQSLIYYECSLTFFFFISLIEVESNFNPNAKSHVGAFGYTQIMPETANSINNIYFSNYHLDYKNEYDNITMSIVFLNELINRYDGNLEYVLRFYNGGVRWRRIPQTKRYYNKILNLNNILVQKYENNYLSNI